MFRVQAVADAIIAALQADGRLVGSLFSTDRPSNNGFQAPATFTTTLTVVGQTGDDGDGDGGGDDDGGGGGTGNWNFSLTNPNQSAPPGSLLVFNSVISNSTGADLFIDTSTLGFVLPADMSSYSFDYDPAFLDTLGIIPTTGYAGPLFFIQFALTAPVGAAGMGSVELGMAPTANPASRSAAFTASVAPIPTPPVPEPGIVTLIVIGGCVAARRLLRARTCRQSGPDHANVNQ